MGPSVNIMLKGKLDDAQKEEIIAFLRKISSNIEKSNYETCSYNFWIENVSFLGYTYNGIGLPFGMNFSIPEYEKTEEHQINKIKNYFGFTPMDEIAITAFFNDADSHRILGHLALILAEKYDGLIDLTGAITPPIKEDRAIKEYPYCTIKEIRNFVCKVEGKICEIEYEVKEGKKWIYHVVDTTFLKNWLKHSHFHMIK
ncbi:DUF6368 family protein [Acetivibrio clariflavus]|uniref:Uncharacterized protein n=1 Tax=Acetivibrio clariflavus (strain DSM 19732 / NBRC 101661 / EBR45) TaxID=720554 RepID=G8LWA1_ACECE|nr:DUF6368 family protein [Acetivibrio clariflavus]AEV69748.1 hypothetical protein Clocl_3233 [Acetivibrio clariflavus DSM 19732]